MIEKFLFGKIVSVVKRDEYSEILIKVSSTACGILFLLIFIKLRHKKKLNIKSKLYKYLHLTKGILQRIPKEFQHQS